MDKHTKEQRSYNMSQVKSKNTKPELLMFMLLDEAGLIYDKHYPITGKPDIAFPEYKLAIFIDGEFWHGKNYKQLKQTISPFWVKKIGDNLRRDRKIDRELRTQGWHIMHLWGKKITRNPLQSLMRIKRFINRVKSYP